MMHFTRATFKVILTALTTGGQKLGRMVGQGLAYASTMLTDVQNEGWRHCGMRFPFC
jgi:hypothetical protein